MNVQAEQVCFNMFLSLNFKSKQSGFIENGL